MYWGEQLPQTSALFCYILTGTEEMKQTQQVTDVWYTVKYKGEQLPQASAAL